MEVKVQDLEEKQRNIFRNWCLQQWMLTSTGK